MVTVSFFAFLVLTIILALTDWRRGWLMAVVAGVLQDPARKLTPGTPPVMTMSVAIVFLVIVASRQELMQKQMRDFSKRYPRIYLATIIFIFFLALAAINGVMTFGLDLWKVPALSLIIYLIPIPAIIFGYAYFEREQQLTNFLIFYAVLTTIALIGTPLEYYHVNWQSLGMVALPEGFIRHLPGIQIRILSGFYRAPDIMAWHAATLTIVAVTLALRGGVRKGWPWVLIAAWGFLNALISGRRKATYMVIVWVGIFFWRYFRRLTIAQIVSLALVLACSALVVQKLNSDEESSVYAKGSYTTSDEVYERLEGGLMETFAEYGLTGAGLGTATQGVRHLLGTDQNVGWQEGGLGKLAVELGLQGLLGALFLLGVSFALMYRLTSFPDEKGTSQIYRAFLFAFVLANGAEFLASAQAYSDATLTLLTAFLIGALFATPKMAELAQVPPPALEAKAAPLLPARAVASRA